MDWEWARIGQFVGSLWDAVTADAPRLWGRMRASLSTWWQDKVAARATAFLDSAIGELEQLGLGRESTDQLRRFVSAAPSGVDILVIVVFGLLVKLSVILPALRAVGSLAQRAVNRTLRSQPPDQASLLRFLELYPDQRSPSGQDARRAAELLDQLGLTDDDQRLLLDARRQSPDLTAILQLRNRRLIDDEQALELLGRSGYRGEDPERLLELRRWWPSPQDLVTLAGREAFEPDAIRQFELDADYPEVLDEVGEIAGISPEWMRRFWVAHWTTPSLNQAFEMARREVKKPDGQPFGVEDLEVYYRLADITPFFGDLLKQIAFTPPGRIDIRRMVRYGQIDHDEAIRRYRHIGYSPEDAVLMADFAISERDRVAKDLSRSQLERLLDLGLIDRLEYETRLEAMGFDSVEAGQLATLAEDRLTTDRTEQRRELVDWRYQRHLITREQAMAQLAELGMLATEVERHLDEQRAEGERQQALPSISIIEKWWNEQIIDLAEARRLLLMRRVPPDHVDRYLGRAPKIGGDLP